MIRKLTIIVIAILINCLILGGLHAWTAGVANAAQARSHADRIHTLPTINVYPDAEQLRELRGTRSTGAAPETGAGGSMALLVMPFYSFAHDADSERAG